MEFILYLFRGIGLLMALQGFMYMGRKHLKINSHFIPIFTISSITILVFLAGILGILYYGTLGIYFLGILCSLYSIFFDYRKNGLQFHITIPMVFVFLGFLVFSMLLVNTELIHYDNFTHWATVVKELLMTDAFPTAESTMIEFTNYPLGSTSFIYFVCTLVGEAQGIMLVAQATLIFACFASTFAMIQERRRALLHLTLALGLTTLSFFNVSIRINNLLVDFMLPMLTLAALSVIYTYRRHMEKAFLIVTPMLGLLVIIKSTGIIFAVIVLIYLLFATLKYNVRIWWQFICSALLSLAPLLIWNKHVDLVFAGIENKFETDISVLSSGISGKTPEDIQLIVNMFLSTFLDFSLRPTIGLWAFEILAILGCVIGCIILKKKWFLPKILIISNLILLLYYSGILAMYLYAMPLEEALYLAGYDRYASSIIVLFGGILALCLTVDIENSFYYKLGEVEDYKSFYSIETKNVYNISCIVCSLLIFMILTSEYNGIIYLNNSFRTSLPAQVQSVVGDNWDEVDHSNYLLYAPDYDGQVTSYYMHYVARYYLWADNIDCICLFYEDNMLNLLSQYDYLVIIESDEDVRSLMQKYFGLTGDPGIYDTQELLANSLLEN